MNVAALTDGWSAHTGGGGWLLVEITSCTGGDGWWMVGITSHAGGGHELLISRGHR